MADVSGLWSRRKDIWLSVGAGVVLGCIFRLAFGIPNFNDSVSGEVLSLFTLAFLVAAPFAIGYVSVRLFLKARQGEPHKWYQWLFLPWLCMLFTIVVWFAIHWEGMICILFASPILFLSSLLGGVAARIVWGKLAKRSPGVLSAVAFPILFLAIESTFPSPYEIRTVQTQIAIQAPPQVVWNEIKSVRAIAPQELPPSWINQLGFPRPIAATLSHEGIGGVRQASFTGGLLFTETVNQWDPQHDLRFTIHANTGAIPRSTFDEHATIGGAFFDVLEGEYTLEPTTNGVLLQLSSHERLSTHLNPYAAFWTDAVMRTIQNQILVVIKHRCEQSVPATSKQR
jgi:hypothetical protein